MKYFFQIIFVSAVLMATSRGAVAEVLPEPDEALAPKITFQVRDAVQLHQFLRQNTEAKRFVGSNLFRGLFYRLNPVFGMLGSEYAASWQGTLLDFAYEKTMAGHPLTLAYYPQRRLNSPFGSAIGGLGSVEQKLVATLTKSLGATDHQIRPAEKGGALTTVRSVKVQNQLFAQGLNNGCLGLSRDPYVTAHLMRSCARPQADATVEADLRLLFPALSSVYRRFFSEQSLMKLNFAWDPKSSSWKPRDVQLPLNQDHQFKTGAIPSGFFAAVPSSTALLIAAQVPDPKGFGPDQFKSYLGESATIRRQRDPVTVGLIAFWLEHKLETAILIGKEASTEEMEGFRELYGESGLYSIHFARVCKQFVGVAPNASALEELNKACAGSVPNMLHLAQAGVQKLHGQNPSVALLVNLGKLLDETFKSGLASIGEGSEGAPEVKEAQSILNQLPYYLFAGSIEDNNLVMKEVL